MKLFEIKSILNEENTECIKKISARRHFEFVGRHVVAAIIKNGRSSVEHNWETV